MKRIMIPLDDLKCRVAHDLVAARKAHAEAVDTLHAARLRDNDYEAKSLALRRACAWLRDCEGAHRWAIAFVKRWGGS